MIATVHLISSLILAAILFPFFGFYSFFVFIGGFLIDIDHMMYYIAMFKKADIKKCYAYFMEAGDKGDIKRYKSLLRVFHSFELLLIFIILSFFSKVFLIITLGLILHYILDFINEVLKLKLGYFNFSYIQWIKNNVIK